MVDSIYKRMCLEKLLHLGGFIIKLVPVNKSTKSLTLIVLLILLCPN